MLDFVSYYAFPGGECSVTFEKWVIIAVAFFYDAISGTFT